MTKWRVGVEYSPSTLEPVRPGALSPDRALYLPTLSHFVIVDKTSLSVSVSPLSLPSGRVKSLTKRRRFPHSPSSSSPISHTSEEASSKLSQSLLASALEVKG
jgi:hypothetical protein